MFGSLGIGELILLAGLALVIIGPEKFPEFVKIVMRAMRDLRSYVDETKRDIAKEIEPVKKEIEDLSRIRPDDYIESLTNSYEENSSEVDTGVSNSLTDDPNNIKGETTIEDTKKPENNKESKVEKKEEKLEEEQKQQEKQIEDKDKNKETKERGGE